jgi:uncharacterized protein YukJ
MPLASYGVLAGRVVDRRAEGGTDSPHYQVQVRASGVDYRVAVNVLSQLHPSELSYVADEAFAHPLLRELPGVAEGFTLLPRGPGGSRWTSSVRTCSTASGCGRCPPPRRDPTTTWRTSWTTSWAGP